MCGRCFPCVTVASYSFICSCLDRLWTFAFGHVSCRYVHRGPWFRGGGALCYCPSPETHQSHHVCRSCPHLSRAIIKVRASMQVRKISLAALLVLSNAICSDRVGLCGRWAADGECAKNPEAMRYRCPQVCGFCAHECRDEKTDCPIWARRGECKQVRHLSMNALAHGSGSDAFVLEFCPSNPAGRILTSCFARAQRAAASAILLARTSSPSARAMLNWESALETPTTCSCIVLSRVARAHPRART